MNENEINNQAICRKLVEREVVHCCSYLISDLLKTPDLQGEYKYDDLLQVCIASEYESPAQDEGWEEADIDKDYNYIYAKGTDLETTSCAETWQELCEEERIEPYDREVLEHWIVTKWFAEKLQEHGEIVAELFDFWVWGRCCSGQAILLDGVITEIASEMEILAGQKNEWKS